MVQLIPEIRNAARAVILEENRLLVLRKEGGGLGTRYALPGGGMHPEEDLMQALLRECEEEINTTVTVERLLHVADFFKNSTSQPNCLRHVVEFLFLCRVPSHYQPQSGFHPDKHQVAVEWVDCDKIPDLNLSPGYLSSCLPPTVDMNFYLGSFYDHNAAEKR